MNNNQKHPKMDRHLIAAHESYEISYVVARFKRKHNISVPAKEIKQLCKVFNNSRRKVYRAIGERYLNNK